MCARDLSPEELNFIDKRLREREGREFVCLQVKNERFEMHERVINFFVLQTFDWVFRNRENRGREIEKEKGGEGEIGRERERETEKNNKTEKWVLSLFTVA